MLAAWIAGPDVEPLIGSIMAALAVSGVLAAIVRRTRLARAAVPATVSPSGTAPPASSPVDGPDPR